MDDLVEFVSCDTGSDGGCGEVQNLSPKLSKQEKMKQKMEFKTNARRLTNYVPGMRYAFFPALRERGSGAAGLLA